MTWDSATYIDPQIDRKVKPLSKGIDKCLYTYIYISIWGPPVPNWFMYKLCTVHTLCTEAQHHMTWDPRFHPGQTL